MNAISGQTGASFSFGTIF